MNPRYLLIARSIAAAILVIAAAVPARAQGTYCGPADVAFVIDDTFNTGGVLASVKSALPLILDRIAATTDPDTGAGADYRLSLVTFKDNITVRLPFAANNRDALTPVIDALIPAGGGAGSGNASDEALNTVINALAAGTRPQNGDFAPPFRTDPAVRRVIVLLTGHQPGGFDDDFRLEDVANAHQRALEAAARGIRIVAIFTPMTEAQQGGVGVMQDYATTTGGVYLRTNDNVAVDPGLAVLGALSACAPANRPPRAVCGDAFEIAGPQCGAVPASIDNGSYDPEETVLASMIQTPPGPYPVGTTAVTLRVTDSLGASATCQANVTVECLAKPPMVIVPPDMLVEATGPTGAAAAFEASATDYQGGTLTPACTPASGTVFALGATAVSCSATDANGTGTASFLVTVQDTTPPVMTLPAAMSLSAPDPLGASVTFSVPSTDLVDPIPIVTCTPSSGSTFPIGLTTVRCTARDGAGNVSPEGSFSVSVSIADTTAPVVSISAPSFVEALSAAGAPVSFTVSAADAIDGTVTPACDRTSGTLFPLGSTDVTCAATDAAGNRGTAVVTVRVRDTTPPVLVLPAPITVSTSDPASAVVTFAVTATDLVDPAPLATCAPPSGSSFLLGVTPVRCSATDAHGNTSAEGVFSVTVRPSAVTPPFVSCTPGTNPAGKDGQAGGGFFVINATPGSLGTPPRLTLASYDLANGERIKLTVVPSQSGVRFVNVMNGVRHFHVGRTDAVVRATDESGGSTSAVCPVK